jgi:hypothetical protein
VLEPKVIGRCMQRHCHQEFIRFLNATMYVLDFRVWSCAEWRTTM